MPKSTRACLAIATIAAIAQLYPVPARDNPPASAVMAAPPEVDRILRRACYDCHSNETEWPWYSYVAPASWLVARDVRQGRQLLNFSNWPQPMPAGIDCLFKNRIVERVARNEMPPIQYRLLHPSAAPTDPELLVLTRWAKDACTPEGG